jgi:hypothetical protein
VLIIEQNLTELRRSVVYLRTNCNAADYPTEFQTYDQGWDSLRQSLDYLRPKLGQERYANLVSMVEQAKAHYDAAYAQFPMRGIRLDIGDAGFEDLKLGSFLMQDIEQMIKGKPPFSYPPELYRWSQPSSAD